MKSKSYASYLLRVWLVPNGEENIWRASVEIPGNAQRYGFISFEELIKYLQEQTRNMVEEQKTEGENEGIG